MLIIMIRSLMLYIIIVAALRLMGKKQLGELQPSELVTTILISNIATMSIEDPSLPMLLGIVPIIMIVCIDILASVIMLKSTAIRRIAAGRPRVVISNGEIDQRELKKLRYTVDDLLESMREESIFDINDVRYAIVETTGKINFFKKSDGRCDPPSVIIKDGLLIREGLARAQMSSNDLTGILNERSAGVGDVFLMTAAPDGGYTVILKDKNKPPVYEKEAREGT